MKSQHHESETNLVRIRYPSLIQWLANRLAAAMTALHPFSPLIALPPFSVDIKQLGTFASPILLKLAAQERRSPESIGSQLIANMAQNDGWLVPKLWIHPAGWLYASFADADLAQWLQALLNATPILQHTSFQGKCLSPAIGISDNPILFRLQYAHGRCCSVLKLAQQEQLIQLTESDLKIAHFTTPISWLNAKGELLFQSLSEIQILLALMQFPHSLSPQKQIYGDSHLRFPGVHTSLTWPSAPAYLHRQAQAWSQLFLDFYSECRIFGDRQSTAQDLLQARLGLILLLQRVLAFYLETVFQIDAPVIL